MGIKVSEEEYRLPFFIDNGFIRKKCKVCGSYFWTLNPDLDTCSDSPCVGFGFIGERLLRRGYTLDEMRSEFLNFFNKRGHEVVEPYPVVARWRDDIYLTIASIAVFQPHVTDGLVPPPANPLVISQPCIRLQDLDNVGLTAGRHLSIFEMGGHHAFNHPDRFIYWKDDVVRFNYEFMKDCLGAKPEAITYKEGFWEGGGNAGPDFESCLAGLELSTLVFMQYKVQDGQYIKMPIKVVDTGYGMERFTWLSQGSPSAIHAIYEPLLNKLLNIAGLRIDEDLLVKISRLSGIMGVDSGVGLTKLREQMASSLKIPVGHLTSFITPVEHIYAIADHTRCLAFMLADGVVPSNVGEGYLARLVLRRTLKLMRLLKLSMTLPEIVEMQIELFGGYFPRLKERRDVILEVSRMEEEKYRYTMDRGRGVARKYIKEFKDSGRLLTTELIIKLYDSHGLPPELIKEVAEQENVSFTMPDNFYSLIASRRQQAQVKAEAGLEAEIMGKVWGAPPTIALYHIDPYIKDFEAKVLKVIDGRYVILDRTAFYPEGGGQLGDRGFIDFKGETIPVVEVRKVGDVIIHEVEGSIPVGAIVKGCVDWGRRISLMRHHTATHILMGAARRVLGEHVWQAGAQKGVDLSRLDITHYKHVAIEEAHKIEALANEAITRNLSVTSSFIDREEAEAIYGFRLYQGGVVPSRQIRVVDIEEWEAQACGGTHCKSTGEVGLIKIRRVERVQDGVERIEFSAGEAAIKYLQERELLSLKIEEEPKTSLEKVPEVIRSFKDEVKTMRKEGERLRDMWAEAIALNLKIKAKALGNLKFASGVLRNATREDLLKAAVKLVEKDPTLVATLCSVDGEAKLLILAGEKAVEEGVDASKASWEAAKVLGGGGGGKADLGQGGGPLIDKVDEAIAKAEEVLKKQLKKV